MIDRKIISIKEVSKLYHTWEKPSHRFSTPLYKRFTSLLPNNRILQRFNHYLQNRCKNFYALDSISFDVYQGQSVGILGRNGSGKSTLLQIIAGTLQPTQGSVTVNGRVAALLELGSGFNPEFTGKENVYLNGAVLGLSRRQMEERYDDILAFADIGEFINQPIKTYSSGMVLRLAFAVQILVDPDILIVDEALSVGDSLFQKRCFQRINELVERGTTLLFVSHDVDCVRSLTEQALFLDNGKLRVNGPSAEVALDYRRFLHVQERKYLADVTNTVTKTNREPKKSSDKEFGDFDAVIKMVSIQDANGNECSAFYTGDRVTIVVECSIQTALSHLNIGLRIRNKEGIKMYSWGTMNQDMNAWYEESDLPIFWERSFEAGERVFASFDFQCDLGANFYEVQAYVAEERTRDHTDQRMLHWRDEAAFFNVGLDRVGYFFGGVIDLKMKARFCE